MRKEDFRQWLDGKIKKKPISDCISRCTTVEYALKVDLDEEYRKDNGQAVIAKLSYNVSLFSFLIVDAQLSVDD